MLAELDLLVRYTVTGDDAAYAIPFRVYRAEDVAVTFSTNGRTETSLTLGKDYSVQILPAGGAELTLAAGVAGAVVPAGAVLAIASAVPATQEADFSNTATVNTGALETQLDREVQMIQQLKDGLSRAVMLPAASNESPEELLEDIFTARDTAMESATGAQASANAAANSAQSAAGSAAVATEQREAACICAGEAKDARDVAIAQTEAANTLMEVELAKVNAIVAANKTDQQAAVTAARQWAEKEADLPVDYDEDGNPRYSARHWAENAQKIAIEPPTAERRGAIRVGAGLHLETGENGETDMLAVSAAELGGSLQFNDALWLTESGSFVPEVTGWYHVLVIGGGDGGNAQSEGASSGRSGGYWEEDVYLVAGEDVPVVIGAGGIGNNNVWPNPSPANQVGGITTFGNISSDDSTKLVNEHLGLNLVPGSRANRFDGPNFHRGTHTDLFARALGGGPGGGHYGTSIAQCSATFFGGGGGAMTVPQAAAVNGVVTFYGNGAQGAVYLRFHNPAKASGEAAAPVLFSMRSMARRPPRPVTVNLYDPETGQGSVWREEDAEARLAEGLVTQEAWEEICAAKNAEEYAAWLANPDTEAERFAHLRLARDARLAATDYLVAPDYPLTDEQRGAVTAYRQALRDLPAQEGAPWDGGGELTPWPEAPVVGKAQEEA